jgi:tRNA (guanosine-2'-O-)-methyltransferase
MPIGEDKKGLIEYLSGFVTGRRNELFHRVLENRTRYLTVVLEDIYQSQNASAVLRTCECFGIQDVHIIENRNAYTLNPDVVMGADKWLNMHRYSQSDSNSAEARHSLRKRGYRLVATSLSRESTLLDEFDLRKGKTAIFFGTELTGLTETVLDSADEHLGIPILGFTESFNISVSAAIILHHLCYKLRHSDIDWKLDPEEREEILLAWLQKSIRHSGKLTKRFRNNP